MMKKITNYEYKANTPDGKEINESLADVLGNILLLSIQSNKLKGIDSFRQHNKLFSVIKKAKESGFIELETKDHNYLKEIITKEIPPTWSANNDIYKIIENFLNV